ncbi:MAG: glycosyltransferase family 2 protein [Chitinophagaceae bacterium]|nr:MAG: glycosyltransferase family 2 protein [Chitinophagaceae bacterium]
MKLSVVICAHNPKPDYLNRVLESLKIQTLAFEYWELILIDNGSFTPLKDLFTLSWHPQSKIVAEDKLGLIHARVRGVKEASNDIIISVDDDTPLFEDYLENALRIYTMYPELGIIGGKTVPQFEETPPIWLNEFYSCLAIRDLGDKPIIQQLQKGEKAANYPDCAPILIAPKKECMLRFIEYYEKNEAAQSLGRKGIDLASGEDNDINLFIYQQGYALGYFPALKFYHIIPAKRMKKEYLSKLLYSMNKSWVKVLFMHDVLPWKKISPLTVPLRKAKAWIKYKAWKSEPNYIRWKGACGYFEGLSKLN